MASPQASAAEAKDFPYQGANDISPSEIHSTVTGAGALEQRRPYDEDGDEDGQYEEAAMVEYLTMQRFM